MQVTENESLLISLHITSEGILGSLYLFSIPSSPAAYISIPSLPCIRIKQVTCTQSLTTQNVTFPFATFSFIYLC